MRMFHVYYETFGEVYESDRCFETFKAAETWAKYLLTFGYVSRAWAE